MTHMWLWGLMWMGCQERRAHVPPLELSVQDLGVIHPPFGGRFNAFSALYGPIFRDGACFVLWNQAGDNGQLPRVPVTCPDSMLEWDNCPGLLVASRTGDCECQLTESRFTTQVDCPVTVNL